MTPFRFKRAAGLPADRVDRLSLIAYDGVKDNLVWYPGRASIKG